MKKKHISIFSFFSLVCLITIFQSCIEEKEEWIFDSELGELKVEIVADSIGVPFGISFLSKNKMLVTNRHRGEIVIVNTRTGVKNVLKGVPASYAQGDGGALDIIKHPDYERNGWIYFSHSVGDATKNTMAIDRARIEIDSMVDVQRIFTVDPFYNRPNHYGSRMVIDNGYLYFTMGDRYNLKDSAQTLTNHLGKVMRILEDGGIPNNNPFLNSENALPEIWTYGHRNPQGLIFRPETEELWLHEHGPKGGDEINLIQAGLNYGWPIICYGVDYDGTPIGQGITHKEGLEQPIYQYTPSIAPCGMEFYYGDKFPKWKGNLFIGALALTHLNRLVIENGKVIHEERLLQKLGKRVRVVKQGLDGYLYIGVDGGMILRIKPILNV